MQVNNAWSYTTIVPYIMALNLMKGMDIFTFVYLNFWVGFLL